MFNFTIIVYSNRTAANINTRAYVAIADVGKMWELSTFPNIGVFNLYEVTYMDLVTKHGIRAQVNIWTYIYTVFYFAVMTICEVNNRIITYFYIRQTSMWTNFTALTNDSISFEDCTRVQDCIGPYCYLWIYISIGRINNSNTSCH